MAQTKKQTTKPKSHPTSPQPEPELYNRETDGPMSPYHPRVSVQDQAFFALGSIAVVENLLDNDDLMEESKEGAVMLLQWAREFLETLDLELSAEECQERAGRYREASAARVASARKGTRA